MPLPSVKITSLTSPWTALLITIGICLLSPASWATQTDNHGIHAVPAPGPVAITGSLAGWDLSGQVLQCYDIEALRELNSGEIVMMYDPTALYVGIHWKDPHPMSNSHDPAYEPGKGWEGDSVQLRIKTDRICHVTAWYYAPKHEPCMEIEYGKSLTEAFGGGSKVLSQVSGWRMSDGVEQAFAEDADHHGYVQEMKIPWTLITSKSIPQPGGVFHCGIELLWGSGDWPVHRYADNLAPGVTSREFFWSAINAWGPVTLEPVGHLHLPTPPYLLAATSGATRDPGPVRVPYDLDRDGEVTIAIEDAHGRVRNLLAQQPRTKGHRQEGWDGLDDAGKAVPAGHYTIKGLVHQPLHTRWLMSFASPGNPSWDTPDDRGAFYGDHTAPEAVATAGGFVALACPMGEAGRHLIGCDLQGQRLWGLGNRVAFDGGHISLATDGRILWVANDAKASTIYRVDIATGRYDPWNQVATGLDGRSEQILDLTVTKQPGYRSRPGLAPNLTAIAVHGNVLAVCLAREDLVKLLDATTGRPTSAVVLPAPRSVAFNDAGRLLVLDRDGLVWADGVGHHPEAFTTTDCSDGYSIAFDADGQVYLSRRGGDQDVQVFSPQGRPVRTIGTHGGRPICGPYDPQGMAQPAQIAIDSNHRLWVAEETSNPKRTSVWNLEGKLVKDLPGTTPYCAAGAIDPYDPTIGFSSDVVYHIDLATGNWNPVWSLAASGNPAELFPPTVQEITNRVVVAHGDTYVYTCGNADTSREVSVTALIQGRWRSVAHMGVVGPHTGSPDGGGRSPLFAGHDGQTYAWVDRNGDGLVQADELSFASGTGAPALTSFYWGQLPDADGTIPYLIHGSQAIATFPITGFSACGAPIYDPAHPTIIHADKPVIDAGSEGMIMGGDGGVVFLNQDPFCSVDAKGHVAGTYPSPYVSVHGSHNATAAHAGLLIGPSSILGTAPLPGVGDICYLNGNLGQNFLMTQDGLWIQSLFRDVRGGFVMPAKAVPGEAFDQTTAGGESFGGNFIRTPDGRYLVTLGGTDARVIGITGLETLRRFSGSFDYTPTEVRAAAAFVAARKAGAGRASAGEIAAITAKPPIMDGSLASWGALTGPHPGAMDIAEPDGSVTYGRVMAVHDAQNLYIAWLVQGGHDHMRNSGQDYRLLFKSGDCVDLMLGGPGVPTDERLLISVMSGRPVAVFYQQHVPGTPGSDRVPFSSPSRTLYFDRVTMPAGVHIATAKAPGGYVVMATVPWSVLGLHPVPGSTIHGDVGILVSDAGGRTTIARHYWHNKATGLVNDIPGEAELAPGQWGPILVR